VTVDAIAPPRIGRFVWWLGLVSTVIVLVSGSVIAYIDGLPAIVQATPHLDKVCHFTVFGSIAFFLDGVLRRKALDAGSTRVPIAAVLILVPAALEEYVQRYSPNRSSSIWDFAADVLGVATAIGLSRCVGDR
jgi:hypothetical protein